MQQRFKAVGGFLFKPSPHVAAETQRRNARLLSVILLALVLSNLSGALFTPDSLQLVRSLMAYAEGPLLLFYLLSRTRLYMLAAMLTILTEMVISYVSLSHLAAYDMSTVAASIMWLLLPMFVAAIILPLPLGLLFLVANFLVLLAMPGWVQGFEYSHLGNGLSYVVIASILLLVIAAIRKRDVEELDQRAVELARQKQWLEQEIVERRQAELELSSLQTLLNSINEAVLLISNQGIIERINDTCCEMFAQSRESLLQHNISEIRNQEDGANQESLFSGLMRQRQKANRSWYAFTARRGDATAFPVEAFAEDIELAGRKHYVVTIRDMTEHKRIEGLKDEFISSVSHELRTPLTSIHGAIGLIKGRYSQELGDTVARLINIAYDNSSILSNLVADILDISKLESGNVRLQYEPLSMQEVLHELIRNCQPMFANYHVDLGLNRERDDIRFESDRQRFIQVMNNLLSNAAKFSPEGERVEIDYGISGERIWVTVTDHGSGIPAEFQGRIFDKFFQIDGTSKQSRSGTGLGLSISRRILKQMGGDIRVASEPGRTCFRFELPQKAAN